jgi:phosphoglycerol transferase MdoB-like AlkP superfamily enzyme
MRKISGFIPDHVKQLFVRMSIIVGMLYISRLIFLAFNSSAFHGLGFTDHIVAIWFDIITVALFYIPFYTLFLLPIPIRDNRFYKLFFKLLFHTTNIILLGLNLMDVEYFKYTSKRSTYDLFTLVSTGNDFNQLFTTFITDFWYHLIFLILFIYVSNKLYNKTELEVSNKEGFYRKNIISFIVIIPIMIVIGRGGFALKPVGIIEATRYCKPENTAFILPTAFTMVKTIDQGSLEIKNYFPSDNDRRYFNPVKHSEPQNILPDGTNVMIIMLESFGTEFIGGYGAKTSYTPFLDSIIANSMTFEYGMANGKKSIEAVPAVVASMPTLMDNPYISSPYGNNKINTLPNILKKHGYESAFFHGATNGSMRFDGFASICGYDHYFGRYEYDNDEHFDKTWGILDEYFNPWTAEKMSELKEPFVSTLFTLSSHHPYFIPKHMKNKVKKGPQKICASINYGDYALRRFFEEAEKQDWYKNTLFIIIADHTPASKTKMYNQRTHLYRIPIVFYHPGGKLPKGKQDVVFQQLDIMPTVLDLLNIDTEYYAYGNSLFNRKDREAFTYLEGAYYYFNNEQMLVFSEGKARNLFNFTSSETELVDSISYFRDNIKSKERRIKAIIQRYNRDLIENRTTVDEANN